MCYSFETCARARTHKGHMHLARKAIELKIATECARAIICAVCDLENRCHVYARTMRTLITTPNSYTNNNNNNNNGAPGDLALIGRRQEFAHKI